jgi:DNA-binding transcriptional LysR family regulator
VKVADSVVEYQVVPALCVNDEELETQAVLAGQVLALLTGVAAAPHVRAGRLVPLLTEHVADQSSAFVYYGSRVAVPARVRAFIDLAVQRLGGNRDFVLEAKELAAAEAKGRKQAKRRA